MGTDQAPLLEMDGRRPYGCRLEIHVIPINKRLWT